MITYVLRESYEDRELNQHLVSHATMLQEVVPCVLVLTIVTITVTTHEGTHQYANRTPWSQIPYDFGRSTQSYPGPCRGP